MAPIVTMWSGRSALDKIQQSLDGYPVYNWDAGEAMVAREIELRGPQE